MLDRSKIWMRGSIATEADCTPLAARSAPVIFNWKVHLLRWKDSGSDLSGVEGTNYGLAAVVLLEAFPRVLADRIKLSRKETLAIVWNRNQWVPSA